MAKEDKEKDGDVAEGGGRRGPGAIVWLLLLIFSASVGFAVPFVLPGESDKKASEEKSPPVFEMLNSDQTMAVPFGEVTVNLDEGRMNRYLRLKISVLISKDEEKLVMDAMASKTPILKNWLLSHLSDKTLDEIRGKAGQNMLRREIRRQFNETMFTDRRDHIYDVLFEEFNIQ